MVVPEILIQGTLLTWNNITGGGQGSLRDFIHMPIKISTRTETCSEFVLVYLVACQHTNTVQIIEYN